MLPILEIAQENYPKAYKLLEQYTDLSDRSSNRDLYDFFDDQGLYIEITIAPSSIDDNCPSFEFTIRKGNGTILPVDVALFGYQRFKTELSAFSNAFKILDNLLKSVE